ncbi:amidohydrolase [uncultured Shimia sp.]|uniref:amidohydrolase n=1 Tax=uncultured Shimia sp. TaxID=573152 RepID=UPI0026129466|nr:amidohydrolase [uncultured Shimia sp.]
MFPILRTTVTSCAVGFLSGISVLAQTADTVYTNAQIYTVNQRQPWASALAIKDGKFLAVGSDSEIIALAGAETEKVDLGGQFVMPGFIDTHTHPVRVIMLEDILFRNDNFVQRTPDEFGQVLKEYVANNPDKEWIYGASFSWSYFEGTDVKVDRHFLDKYVSDRPVVIEDDGGHAAVANTAALQAAGITKDTPDPIGGTLVRDETGAPTGMLYSAPAMKLVLRHHPRYDIDDVVYAAEKASGIINAFGYTGIKVLEGDREQMQAFKRLDEEGKLKLDVRMTPYQEDFFFAYSNEDAILDRDQYETEHFKVDGVKLFIDSTPFGRAIAVKQPYKGDGTDFGKPFTTYEAFRDDYVRWNSLGLSVATHTMGDRGFEMVVDAMLASAAANGLENVRALRNHIAHAMMVDPLDLARLRDVGGYLEFSPNVFLGLQLIDTVKKDMEMSQISRFWPARDVVASGVGFTIATDWIQSPMHPFLHIEQAMTRRPAGDPDAEEIFATDQTISLAEAIRAFTIYAARLARIEDRAGSIEVGKNANFITVSGNPFDTPVFEIHKLFAKKVVFEGELLLENQAKLDRN